MIFSNHSKKQSYSSKEAERRERTSKLDRQDKRSTSIGENKINCQQNPDQNLSSTTSNWNDSSSKVENNDNLTKHQKKLIRFNLLNGIFGRSLGNIETAKRRSIITSSTLEAQEEAVPTLSVASSRSNHQWRHGQYYYVNIQQPYSNNFDSQHFKNNAVYSKFVPKSQQSPSPFISRSLFDLSNIGVISQQLPLFGEVQQNSKLTSNNLFDCRSYSFSDKAENNQEKSEFNTTAYSCGANKTIPLSVRSRFCGYRSHQLLYESNTNASKYNFSILLSNPISTSLTTLSEEHEEYNVFPKNSIFNLHSSRRSNLRLNLINFSEQSLSRDRESELLSPVLSFPLRSTIPLPSPSISHKSLSLDECRYKKQLRNGSFYGNSIFENLDRHTNYINKYYTRYENEDDDDYVDDIEEDQDLDFIDSEDFVDEQESQYNELTLNSKDNQNQKPNQYQKQAQFKRKYNTIQCGSSSFVNEEVSNNEMLDSSLSQHHLSQQQQSQTQNHVHRTTQSLSNSTLNRPTSPTNRFLNDIESDLDTIVPSSISLSSSSSLSTNNKIDKTSSTSLNDKGCETLPHFMNNNNHWNNGDSNSSSISSSSFRPINKFSSSLPCNNNINRSGFPIAVAKSNSNSKVKMVGTEQTQQQQSHHIHHHHHHHNSLPTVAAAVGSIAASSNNDSSNNISSMLGQQCVSYLHSDTGAGGTNMATNSNNVNNQGNQHIQSLSNEGTNRLNDDIDQPLSGGFISNASTSLSSIATCNSSSMPDSVVCGGNNGTITMPNSTEVSPQATNNKHSTAAITATATATTSSICVFSSATTSGTTATALSTSMVRVDGSKYPLHEQIIMSGQQKSALQEKPKPLVVSPQQVMVLYMHKLTPYERTEILAYPQIYFIGANAKKRPGIFGPNNSDYDNDQGAYIHIPHDHVAYRYEVLKIIGKGSFGQVVKAYDHKTHEHVALKMVRNEKRFHRQAQEEIRILYHLRKQDKYNTMNIIHMYDYFTFRNHMCITFELLNINLYELIKKNGFKGFSLQLVRKFAHSLLQCLDALYKNKIIHCDMKPENVLLKQQGRSGIKVIDFGSSCYENQRVYTYIQSRFYRAPEVILGAKYGMAIDMWSLGCILAELLSGHALFPGENEDDQLACIIEVLGMPNKNILTNAKRTKNFFNPKGYPRYCMVRTMPDGKVVLIGGHSRRGKPRGPPCSKSLSKALDGCKDPLFLNFIRGCLEWDPEKRLTPAEALKHPWLRRRLPRPPHGEPIPVTSGVSGGSSCVEGTVECTSSVAALSANALVVTSCATHSSSSIVSAEASERWVSSSNSTCNNIAVAPGNLTFCEPNERWFNSSKTSCNNSTVKLKNAIQLPSSAANGGIGSSSGGGVGGGGGSSSCSSSSKTSFNQYTMSLNNSMAQSQFDGTVSSVPAEHLAKQSLSKACGGVNLAASVGNSSFSSQHQQQPQTKQTRHLYHHNHHHHHTTHSHQHPHMEQPVLHHHQNTG
ncbi:dual specificity tyrosine-phosphorylation-regulated kinase mbk-2 isoform X3 [Eupeodes corollae]|uniref:dual specificity tyrosine-phosphorylation-regulated kinase mbk-2 isoform X3 n=1 Tax=Eupeodes corollae TaxID=290404 RepID=UPI00249194C0|nr:dual specificity tyrosine-phosphorylation-regulated kinase mbk-2 isoform X3 [Eupeodes corollae]